MEIKQSIESIKDLSHEAAQLGKLALIKVLDWGDDMLCRMNDLGDEE